MPSVYEFKSNAGVADFLRKKGYAILENGGVIPWPVPPGYNTNCILGKLSRTGSLSIGNHTRESVRNRQNNLRTACALYLREASEPVM